MIRSLSATAISGLALALAACGGAEQGDEPEVDVPERTDVDVAEDDATAEAGMGEDPAGGQNAVED